MIIKLPIKPLSINAYYRNSKFGKRVKTGKGLAFDEEIEVLLEDYATALIEFGKEIDPSKNIVKLTMIIGNTGFFVKDGGRLSKTSGDIDNNVKILQDKIFRKMGVDDYIVRDIRVLDFPYKVDNTIVRLEIVEINEHLKSNLLEYLH